MLNYNLVAGANLGAAFVEDAGSSEYRAAISFANMSAETSIANTDLVCVNATTVKKITLQNFAASISAAWFTTGSLADARLSANVPLKNASASITGAWSFTAIDFNKSSRVDKTNLRTGGSTGVITRDSFSAVDGAAATVEVVRVETDITNVTGASTAGRYGISVNVAGILTTGLNIIGGTTLAFGLGITTATEFIHARTAGSGTQFLFIEQPIAGTADVGISIGKNSANRWNIGAGDTSSGELEITYASTSVLGANRALSFDTSKNTKVWNNLTVVGGVKNSGFLSFPSGSKVVTGSTVLTQQEIAYSFLRLLPASSLTMAGTAYLPDPTNGDGTTIAIMNNSAFVLTLSSGAGYNTSFGTDIVLAPNAIVMLIFSSTTGLWHKLTEAAGGTDVVVDKVYFGDLVDGNYIEFSSGKFRFFKSDVETSNI